jgi:AsmA protein
MKLKSPGWRVIKITGVSFISLAALLLLLPELFPGYVSKKINGFINENIEGQLNFRRARFSLIKHFPAFTISLIDFSLKGSEPFPNDTLLAGRELAFGLNIFTIFREKMSVNQFFLENAFINLQVDSSGAGNYNIVKKGPDTISQPGNANGSASLRIERISIKNSRLVYQDRSLPMLLIADTLNYAGKGDLTLDIVDLESDLKASGIDFTYDGEKYASGKTLKAVLVTRLNTNNLEFSFTKNDLLINQLPVDFKGFIRFPESGYDIDLRFKSEKTNLRNVITVMPPPYLGWLEETEVHGIASLFLDFAGSYRAETGENPSLKFGLDIDNGFINHARAPVPVSNVGMRFRMAFPQLSYDSLSVDIDTLHMNIDKGFVRGNLHLKNLNTPFVKSTLQANADLGQLMRASGYKELQLQGLLIANAVAEVNMAKGFYTTTNQLPYVNADIKWQQGLLKSSYYPAPIKDIDMKVLIENKTGTYRDLKIDLQPITFSFEGQSFHVKAKLENFESLKYHIESKGTLDLEKISKVLLPDRYGIETQGFVQTDLILHGTEADAVNGRLHLLNNSGTLTLKDIRLKSSDLPHPIYISRGKFHIHQDKLNADDLLLTYGSNELRMHGYYKNLFPFMAGTGPLKGGLTLKAETLNLNEFAANLQTDTLKGAAVSRAEPGVVMLPKDLDISLNALIKEAIYDQFKMQDIKGTIQLLDGKLLLQDAGMKMAGAKAALNAAYQPLSTTKALFKFDIKADSFDIERFYKEVPMFAEIAPSAKTAKGQVSLNYSLGGRLDANMMPVMPSLAGKGTLTLNNVQVNGLKLFSAVSNATGRDSLNNPNLKSVSLNTSIANNIMTLERTKMRIFGFRPRLEGQVSLDGKLNLQFRLGLPPFGIIGIPMTISGTSEKPVVQMRKGKETDELNETEEDEDEVSK